MKTIDTQQLRLARGVGAAEERDDVLRLLCRVAERFESSKNSEVRASAMTFRNIIDEIEVGEHRVPAAGVPRKCWIGSRGTIITSSNVALDDYASETFIVGMLCTQCFELIEPVPGSVCENCHDIDAGAL